MGDDSTIDVPRPASDPPPGHGPFAPPAGPQQYLGYATPAMLGHRTGGLMVFGIISIILGALAGCGALAMPLTLVTASMQPAGQVPGVDVRSVIVGLVTYAAISAAFVTLGIGSLLKKRWVRPVILSLSLPGFVMGVFAYAVLLYMLPDMFRPLPGQPQVPAGMLRAIKWSTAAISLVVYVGLPAAYFFFYRSTTLRDTLEALDPQPRWTDRAPLPVLGLSIWLALAAVMATGSMVYPIVPVFGRYVTGPPAVALAAAAMLLLATAAVLTYRSNVAGWWLALVLLVAVTTTYAWTFYTRGMIEYYRRAGFTDEEVQMFAQVPASGPRRWETLASLVPATLALGYLLWVHRYFTSRRATAAAA